MTINVDCPLLHLRHRVLPVLGPQLDELVGRQHDALAVVFQLLLAFAVGLLRSAQSFAHILVMLHKLPHTVHHLRGNNHSVILLKDFQKFRVAFPNPAKVR